MGWGSKPGHLIYNLGGGGCLRRVVPLGRPNPKPQSQLWPPVAQTSSPIYTKEPDRVPLPHNQAPTSLRGLCNDSMFRPPGYRG